MHRLARLSLANRSVVALATIIIAAFGVLSLGGLKQELIPSFETPQAAIITTYPGASAGVIDKQVSQKIEAQVRTLDGLETSTSTSQNNLSIVRVTFKYGTTTAKVKENLNAVIATVESSLPDSAKAKVVAGSFDSVPIISLGVSSSDNEKLGPILEEWRVDAIGGAVVFRYGSRANGVITVVQCEEHAELLESEPNRVLLGNTIGVKSSRCVNRLYTGSRGLGGELLRERIPT